MRKLEVVGQGCWLGVHVFTSQSLSKTAHEPYQRSIEMEGSEQQVRSHVRSVEFVRLASLSHLSLCTCLCARALN